MKESQSNYSTFKTNSCPRTSVYFSKSKQNVNSFSSVCKKKEAHAQLPNADEKNVITILKQ